MEGQNEKKGQVLSAEDVQALAPLYSDVVLALKQVYDPEIPVNIYDLGLIYELNINKGRPGHKQLRNRTRLRAGMGHEHALRRGPGRARNGLIWRQSRYISPSAPM